MLGVIYLILACFIGYNLIKKFLPGLFNVSKNGSFFGKRIKLDSRMVTYPASFLIGTLILTWLTYLSAYAFHFTGQPMLVGNIISLTVFTVIAVYIVAVGKEKRAQFTLSVKKFSLETFYENNRLEVWFLLVITLVSIWMMFYTFNIKNGQIYIGQSVFSDFGPHLAVIRSFSQGANFPTQYPHFGGVGTGNDIRYHFLFQFLAGNLEFLGMRLDWAFNLPSILSLVSFLMLLYSLVVLLMGDRRTGLLACILFFFRSSFAFFTYLADMKGTPLGQILSNIIHNDKHIGKTQHEDWGLWAQNVYVNQRHFAFSLAIFMLILIVLTPLLRKMVESLKKAKAKAAEEAKKQGSTSSYFKYWIDEVFLKRDAWLPKDMKRCVAVGLMLGLIGFWNGAVVFAALPVLFIIALFSKHRLEYLNIAILTVVLAFAESKFFITQGAAVTPQLTVGFLADHNDIVSILKYYVELLGVLPFVVLAGLFTAPKGGKWLALSFLMPLIMATTLQLTPDIAVNHKYVIMSVILFNIIAANFLMRLFTSKKAVAVTLAAILTFMMTITGVVDLITLYNMNNNRRSITINTKDPLMLWTEKNTKTDEIFLSDAYCIHPILLAGRKIFFGWSYFTWSAGYDTASRENIVKEIYGATDEQVLKTLVTENNISYIVFEDSIRNSQDFKANEDLIKKTYKVAYEDDSNRVTIYKTH